MAFAGVPNIGSAGVAILPNVDPTTFVRSLNRQISGPLAAAGTAAGAGLAAGFIGAVAAASQAADAFVPFEESLTRITTLVGIAEADVEALGEAALDLAPETGRGPQELADALFFITSAGQEGAVALDTLDASAKAAALGLGETETVADAATSAMNAYGAENLSASDAVSVLVKAVEQGKLEADSLAGSIGRVIPLASEAGVSFNDVAAALAAVSRTGLDAEEGATALRGLLSTIVNPSTQARDALASYGLTAEGLAETLRGQGLLALLDELRTNVGGNTEALGTIIPNVRALTGFLSLTGSNAASTARIFGELADVTGLVDERFAQLEDSQAFRRQQADAARLAVLVGEGSEAAEEITQVYEQIPGLIETVLPPLVDVGSGVLEIVGNLTAGGIAIVESFAQVVDATPPLVRNLGLVAAAAAALYANPVLAGLGAVATVIGGIGAAARESEADVDRLAEALADGDLTDGVDALIEAAGDAGLFAQVFRGFGDVRDNLRSAGIGVDQVTAAVERLAATTDDQFSAFEIGEALGLGDRIVDPELASFVREAVDAFREYRREQGLIVGTSREAAQAGAALVGETIRQEDAAADAAVAQADLNRLLGALDGDARRAGSAIAGVLNPALSPLAELLASAADEGESLNDALLAAADPAFGAFDAVQSYADLLDEIDEDGARTAAEQLELARALAEVSAAVGNLDVDPATLEAFFAILREADVDPATLTALGARFNEAGQIVGFELADGTVAGVEDGLGERLDQAWQAAVEDASALVAAGIGTPVLEDGKLVGVEFADGTILGLDTLAERFAAKASSEISTAIGTVRDRFGIRSPSTVTRDQVGRPLGEGMVAGAEEALAAGIDTSLLRFPSAAALAATGASTVPAAGGGGLVVNVNYPTPEPTERAASRAAAAAALTLQLQTRRMI